jgi:hypothetical protein
LYILISPLCDLRFMFIFFGYSKHLYSHLLYVSCDLLPRIISIFTYVSRLFCNNSILKHLRSVSFEFLPLCSRGFRVSISSNVHWKSKVSHHKFMLWDDTLVRHNLIIMQFCLFSLLVRTKLIGCFITTLTTINATILALS